jgi:DNA-binding FadR family transcriptional regulator
VPSRQPTSKRRLAEVVAERIEHEIVSRGWPVGEVIGSEPELIERMNVSRAVLREAVRIVEHHQVARMRRGPGGGLVVTEPDVNAVLQAVALYLRYAGVRRDSLFQTRMTLELACVAQVAETIDEEGIKRLRDVLALEESLREEAIPTGHMHDVHIVIAELTGNPVMGLFVRVLTELTRQQQRPHEDPAQAAEASHRIHVGLVDAIISGDAAVAQHRMRRHIEAITSIVGEEPNFPDLDPSSSE